MFFGLVNRNDLFLVVASTSLANSMRHHKRTTFAAFYQVRSTHFPVCSSLISSSFGRFILRTNRHRLHLLYAFSIQFIVRRTCTGGPSHSHFIEYTRHCTKCQAIFWKLIWSVSESLLRLPAPRWLESALLSLWNLLRRSLFSHHGYHLPHRRS